MSTWTLLDVYVTIERSHERVGDEIVLHSRVDLHNVPSLPSHVEVVDGGPQQLLRP